MADTSKLYTISNCYSDVYERAWY